MVNQEAMSGFKDPDVGVIPADWVVKELADASKIIDSLHVTPSFDDYGYSMVRATEIKTGILNLEKSARVNEKTYNEFTRNYKPAKGDIVLSRVGTYIGVNSYVDTEEPFCLGQNTVVIHPFIVGKFLYYMLNSKTLRKQIDDESYGTSGQLSLSLKNIKELKLPIPNKESEQSKIANILTNIDNAIESLDKLIEKKKNIKWGTMRELITGKKRLLGFKEKWVTSTLMEITYSLDNLRVPLNEAQRLKMRGDYPYCGANGILDYINSFAIDDDIILMAEDGGYFDEYLYRPIAYRMKGKCWVNNHAHILKAKENFSQDFVFYSLEHRNILRYLTNGTRSKLNKAEMNKIEIQLPVAKEEQTAIAQVLSDIDSEIQTLELKRDKYKQLKVGLMQQLLTGRIRLKCKN